ncbi:MAG TPA: alpha-hydroxy acid oxidase [Acidimicrobiales bacterium]|nr:alpha-hydroxy acid oxidase [Acidimicrobiales bacterium]
MADEEFATLDEIVDRAREKLGPAVWDFLEGGAGDEDTLVANRAAFRRWTFRPKVFSGVTPPDTTTEFLGLHLTMPIVTAPFAGDMLYSEDDHEGFAAVVRACADMGTIAIVPESTADSLEGLAAKAPAAARIFQLTPLGTDEDFVRLIRRAEAAAYAAICVTADVPVVGIRRRNARNRFVALGALALGNFAPEFGIDPARYFGHTHRLERPDWSWQHLAEVYAGAGVGIPFLVKGIMTADDARAAINAGASAVYVSNHGGRQLDGLPGTLDQLEEVAAEVQGDVPVVFDGGVSGGADVVKALALGADVVAVGRAAAVGLVAGGQAGVQRVLEILRHELETTMVLLGRASIAALDRSIIQPTREPL